MAAENGLEGQVRWTLTRLGLAIFFSMNVMVFTLAMWTQNIYDDSVSSAHGGLLLELFRYLCLLLSTPVLFLLGVPLWRNAIHDLRHRRVTTDLLIVIGVGAAFAYSVLAVIRGDPHVYFEVTCMVLVAVTLGRWLEAAGKQRTTDALRSLEKLLPDSARVVAWMGGSADRHRELELVPESTLPLDELRVGHVIRVLPGERIPVDGVIHRGQAAIDQQLVTGESRLAIKETEDEVFAGTVNMDGDLLIEVRRPPRAGTLQRIVEAVQQAAMSQGRLQSMSDRIASWFVPLVTLIAVGTFLAHWRGFGLDAGLMAALAVLLIACPCALGIATPMAVHAALGRAARQGVLFRHGDNIEQLARVRAACFDKTGTLTTGRPVIERFILEEALSRHEVLRVAAMLAAASTHGLAAAIQRYCGLHDLHEELRPTDLSEVKALPGRGLSARVTRSQDTCFLGSPRFMAESELETSPAIEKAIRDAREQGAPVVCVGWNRRVQGIFIFREELREEATRVVDVLRQRGICVTLLTGDHGTQAVAEIASLGVTVKAELSPEDKLAAIEELRKSYGLVAMIGDGINDAPALAQADVGIAMGCGADVSREAADICLLSDDLGQIPWAIDFAKRTSRTIRHNLVWAFAYNGGGILLAITGKLNPIWAAVGMVGSSLFVITNSLRLGMPPAETHRAPSSEGDSREPVSMSGPPLIANP